MKTRDYFAEAYPDVSDGYIVGVEDLFGDTGGFYGPYKTSQETIEMFNTLYESAKSNGHKVEIEYDSFKVDDEVRIFLLPGLGAILNGTELIHPDFK